MATRWPALGLAVRWKPRNSSKPESRSDVAVVPNACTTTSPPGTIGPLHVFVPPPEAASAYPPTAAEPDPVSDKGRFAVNDEVPNNWIAPPASTVTCDDCPNVAPTFPPHSPPRIVTGPVNVLLTLLVAYKPDSMTNPPAPLRDEAELNMSCRAKSN